MKNEINRPPMAVILAAGIGSRLAPLTDNCPKSLLSVDPQLPELRHVPVRVGVGS
jgi:NDP-sugar pyrophosphorylase family protein